MEKQRTPQDKVRTERDSLGEKEVPTEAYYGIQTQRAVENFPVSGLSQHSGYIQATALVKEAAAEVHMQLGLLDDRLGKAIVQAAQEIAQGRLRDQFVVDVFQAGAGTSHNMNANEVIANRAIEILGGKKGDYSVVHPNDHVNMAQSTNDVIPTVIRISTLLMLRKLLPTLRELQRALNGKALEFDHVVKSGRTHLQDAVPIRMGQEFGGYGRAIQYDIRRIEQASDDLKRLGIGGTAAGTGLNAHPDYHPMMVKHLSRLTGTHLRSSGNLFESMQNTADFLHLSAALRTLATTLTRIANDLRLLASGPMTGLNEVILSAVQPGSSIMPGKVNPSMAEMLNMVCFHVIGNDAAVSQACQAGQLELNVMMPIIAYNLLQSIDILDNGVQAFTEKCVKGLEANEEYCKRWLDGSMGIATALNPYIGYSQAAKVAQEALASKKTVRQVVLEKEILTQEQIEEILSPRGMTEPREPNEKNPA